MDSEEGFQRLQRGLDQLEKRAEKWKMEFNAERCEILHFGRTNQSRTYRVNGRTLKSAVEQRDLGI